MSRLSVVPALMLLALSHFPLAQSNPSLTRTEYEVGLQYDDPVGVTDAPCDADDYSNTVDWGDSSTIEKIRTDAPPKQIGNATVVPKGQWHLISQHAYKSNRAFQTVVTNHYHCYGATDSADLKSPAPVTVNVHPRVSVAFVAINTEYPLKAGGSGEVKITLADAAPPSNTRVFISVDPPKLLDTSVGALPPYVDITPQDKKQKLVTLHFVPKLASPQKITFSAQAGGNAQKATFTISP